MASTTHSTHLPSFGEPHQREEVGRQLQMLLVELWMIRTQFTDSGSH